jgi:feruloyl esterase
MTLNFTDILEVEAINPGQMDVVTPDMTEFTSHGGKLIHYVGWADQLIAPGNSIDFYNSAARFYAGTADIDEFCCLFPPPGMLHCAGPGDEPNAFGQFASPLIPPLQNDSDHNILLALINWVEADKAPTKVIAAKYTNDSVTVGVNITRPLCMYLTVAVYSGKGSI